MRRGKWWLLLGLLAWGAAAAGGRHFYVVEDEHGVVRMYDVLPPEAASRCYRVVDEQGVTVKVVPPRSARSVGRLSRHDRALLATFSSESEILIARDRQLATMESLIRLNERNLPLYEQNLAELEAQARALEAAGEPVPESLREDIETVRRQIADRRAFIEAQRREMAQVRARYDADLERFRALKAAGF